MKIADFFIINEASPWEHPGEIFDQIIFCDEYRKTVGELTPEHLEDILGKGTIQKLNDALRKEKSGGK